MTKIALSGTLEAASVAELLASAHRCGISGTLELRAPDDRTTRVVVSNGMVLKARATPAHTYLGGVLYELGYIDAAQLNATLYELSTSKRPHGELLRARGLIDDRQLCEGLLQQTARKVHATFGYPNASTYEWTIGVDGLRGYGGACWPAADARAIVWRGIREHGSASLVERALGGAREQRFVLSSAVNLGRFGFDEREISAAECLRVKPMTVDELRRVQVVDERRTELLFACLVLFQQLERRTASAELRVQVAMPLAPSSAPDARLSRPASSPSLPVPTFAFSTPPSSPSMAATRPPSSEGAVTRPPWAFSVPAPAAAPMRVSGVVPLRTESARSLQDAAEARFTEAYVSYRRGDLERARSLCHEATQMKPEDAEYRALHVWLEAQTLGAQSRDATLAAIRQLDAVILAKPESEHAHYYRGQLHKRLGNEQSAARDFQRVVKLNPSNVDAQREIRLHDMRKRNSSGGWKLGFGEKKVAKG